MDPIKIELPEVANEALKPLAASIGNTLSSLWDICFGWVDVSDEKIQHKRLLKLQAFKESLRNNISEIPEENLQEPSLSVVGPALEASKYFFEDEEVRSMFSKLIANSMNRDTASYIQVSFVEIIKQLSPFDAKIITYFKERSQHAIAKMHAVNTRGEFLTVHDLLFFYKDLNESNRAKTMVSLTNLQRLGLIEIDFDESFRDSSFYEIYENSPLRIVSSTPLHIADWSMEESPSELTVFPGIAKLTAYGKAFIDSCL